MIAVLEECKTVCRPTRSNRTNVKCLIKIRKTFYNQALFDYTLPKQKIVIVSKTKTTWVDFLLNFLMTLSILITAVYYLPGLVDRYWPQGRILGQQVIMDEAAIAASGYASTELVRLPDEQMSTPIPASRQLEPAYDLEMEEGRWIISEAAGIRAPIYTNADIDDDKEVNEILDRGIYMYPDYSNIGWQGRRVVLAGHHYNMSVSEQKAAQSFQNLNKLQVGDKVQIADDYKIWTYEIDKVEQSTEITQENPDLMMYTCIFWWDSKLRLFVYGHIVDSQPVAAASEA